MNMCNNCCDGSGYQPNQSMTACPLACCGGQGIRDPIYPVSQQYPSANRRTVVQIQKKCLNSKLGSVNQPTMKRNDKSSVPSSDATCRNSIEKKNFVPKRSVATKSLAVSSGEVRQQFDSTSRNKTKSKRVSHSPCLSSEELGEPVMASKPRKTTKKSTVTASDCNDWPDQAGDVCDDDFTERKSKAPLSDCDSQHFDGTGDDSQNSSDCDEKPKNSTKSKANMMSALEKNCSNYMYDNPELRKSKVKKSCADSCVELDASNESDMEVWLFQCPKDFDPKQVMNTELGKAGRSSQGIEFSADRFCTKQTLAVIAPEKAAEYEMFCDNIKLVKPVGKIVVCETSGSKKSSSQLRDFECASNKLNSSESEDNSEIDECASSEPEEDLRRRQTSPAKRKKASVDQQRTSECENAAGKQPLAGKKIKKQVKDHRFTIETTLTVEKRGANDRKKSYLPIDPPEPEPSTTKKKKKSTKADC